MFRSSYRNVLIAPQIVCIAVGAGRACQRLPDAMENWTAQTDRMSGIVVSIALSMM